MACLAQEGILEHLDSFNQVRKKVTREPRILRPAARASSSMLAASIARNYTGAVVELQGVGALKSCPGSSDVALALPFEPFERLLV